MNRIISLFLFIFIASCLNGQYNSPIKNKVTLGVQTTADGLVWRGRTSDTSNLMTNKLDTSAYLVLDTITEAIWLYRASTTPKWNRVVDSLNNLQGQLSLTTKVTGVLPMANGGTGITEMPAGYILHGNGTSVDTAIGLFWDRSNFELGIGTNNPGAQLNVFDITKDATILINGTSAFEQNFHFFNSGFGITKVKQQDQLDLKSTSRFTFKTGTAGSQVERIRITPTGMAINLATVTPTAYLTLGAGTATAGTAPLKFTSGVSLTTPEVGAMEFSNISGTNKLYISPANNVRKEIAYTDFTNASGVLPVENGGTNASTLAANKVMVGNGTSGVLTPTELNWDNTNKRLGINTSSPVTRLHLNNNGLPVNSNLVTSTLDLTINSHESAGIRLITSNNSASSGLYNFINAVKSRGTNENPSTPLLNDFIFGILSNAYDGSSGGGGTAGIFFIADANVSANVAPQRISFLTSETNNVNRIERLIIKPNGNVGIGTTSPTARLHVKGSTPDGTASAFKIDNSGNTNLLNILNNGATTFTGSVTANSLSLTTPLSVANGGTNASTFTAGSVVFAGTNGTSLTQDNYNLFWDNTGKKLKIGDNTKPYSLSITKSSNSSSGSNYPSLDVSNTLTTKGDGVSTYNFATISMSTGNDSVRLFFYSTFAGGNWEPAGIVSVATNHPLKFRTNATDRIIIANSGAVTINNLAGSGNRAVIADATGLLSAPTSSIMTKENVQALNYGLNEILQINPVSFDYIDKNKWGEERNLGFIVEDMYPIVPEVTGTMNNGDMYLDMVKLIPILTKAIQEQQTLIKALKQRILNLENK